MNKKIHNNINFLKLFLILIIVYYHIIAGKLNIIYPNVDFFSYLSLKLKDTGLYTVFTFFIMSGYFLFNSIKKSRFNIKTFVFKKIISFFPILFFSTLLCAILPSLLNYSYKPQLQSMILNLFFIHQDIGFAKIGSWNGSSWFICCLFWVSIFYYSMAMCLKNKAKFLLITGIICSIGLLLLINNPATHSTLYYGLLPRQLTVGLSGIGMGILLNALFNSKIEENVSNQKNKLLNYHCISLLELSCFLLLILPMLFNSGEIKEPLLYHFNTCLLLALFINKQGWFAKLLESDLLGKISKVSFSIYLMQEVCFIILQATFWKTQYPTVHPVLAFVYSFIFCIFVGILTYKFVEKPVTELLTNKFLNKQNNTQSKQMKISGGGGRTLSWLRFQGFAVS